MSTLTRHESLWCLLPLLTLIWFWLRGDVRENRSWICHPGIWCLAILSLPLLPLIRQTLDYPLCQLMAMLVEPMMEWMGFTIERVDTILYWQHSEFRIESVCSGIRKLWASLYLAATLSWLRHLSVCRSGVLLLSALLLALIGNVARVQMVFYLEMVLIDYPSWWHDTVGLFSFGIVAVLIVVIGTSRTHSDAVG